MDWLGKVQPATAAWACLFAAIIMAGLIAIVFLLRNKKIKSPLFEYGEDGKPMRDENGRVLMAQTAIKDYDAEKIADIFMRKAGHVCMRGPLIEKLVEGHDVHIDAALSVLRDQVDVQKRNGAIGRAKIAEEKHAEEWSEFLKAAALKEGVGA